MYMYKVVTNTFGKYCQYQNHTCLKNLPILPIILLYHVK